MNRDENANVQTVPPPIPLPAGLEILDAILSATNPGSAKVIAAATPTYVFGLNAARLIATVVNDSVNEVYLFKSKAAAVAVGGIPLTTLGSSFEFGRATRHPWCGEVWAFSPVGTTLCITES